MKTFTTRYLLSCDHVYMQGGGVGWGCIAAADECLCSILTVFGQGLHTLYKKQFVVKYIYGVTIEPPST